MYRKQIVYRQIFLCSSFASVIKLFIECAGEELKGKKVAFIPTASIVESVTFYVKSGKKALERAGMLVSELEITRSSKAEICAVLAESDYIYVTGGNTFFLLQELKNRGVDKMIMELVKKGKPYIGESAGAMIVSPDIEYIKAVNFDPISKAPDLNEFSSLDLVDFYTIPHYGEFPFKKKGEKIIQAYNDELKLYPISNKQAVFVRDADIEIKSL
ncbi:MAG: Type 1 glutamine amidotransferase-like domain-containing protein [Bacteroidales bacterium]